MKRGFGREIAVLMLPFLIIGGFAVWKTRLASHFGDGLEDIGQGAPRIEWRGFRVADPTPAQVARGLTGRLQTTLWDGGAMPPHVWRTYFMTYYVRETQRLRLVYRQNGKWKTYRAPDGKNGIRFQILKRPTPQRTLAPGEMPSRADWDVEVLLPLADVPANASEIRLKGGWIATWYCDRPPLAPATLASRGKWDGKTWKLEVASPPFDVALGKLKGMAKPGIKPAVSHETAVKLVDATTLVLPQDITSYSNDDGAGDAAIYLMVSAPVGRWQRRNNRPRIIEARIFDEKGHDWTNFNDAPTGLEWQPGSNGMTWGGSLPNGQFRFDSKVLLNKIPASAGRLKLKLWLTDDANGWPLVLEREVRPLWVLRRTAKLQIESARVVRRVEQGMTAIRPGVYRQTWSSRPKMEIVVRYIGPKKSYARGFTEIFRMQPFDWEPLRPYRDPLQSYGSGTPPKITANDDELLFHWSQHVEMADGSPAPVARGLNSYESNVPPPDAPERLDEDDRMWRLRFDLGRLVAPKPGGKWRFRAQLGVAGDGFIPVDVPLNASQITPPTPVASPTPTPYPTSTPTPTATPANTPTPTTPLTPVEMELGTAHLRRLGPVASQNHWRDEDLELTLPLRVENGELSLTVRRLMLPAEQRLYFSEKNDIILTDPELQLGNGARLGRAPTTFGPIEPGPGLISRPLSSMDARIIPTPRASPPRAFTGQKGGRIVTGLHSDFDLDRVVPGGGALWWEGSLILPGKAMQRLRLAVRPRWFSAAPKTLRLVGIKLLSPKGSDDGGVEITLKSSGKTPLSLLNEPQGSAIEWQARPQFGAQAGREIVWSRRLLYNWSPRLESKDGKWNSHAAKDAHVWKSHKAWLATPVKPGTMISTQELLNAYNPKVQALTPVKRGKLIVVRYRFSGLRWAPQAQLFKAEIGVPGDGFLKVSVPLPGRKKL